MLQAPVHQSPNYSLRLRKKDSQSFDQDDMADVYDEDDDDDEVEHGISKGRNKSRRELPAGAVATLKSWLLSPEHFTHPYPTPQDQAMLMQTTGIDKKQLKNWFTNARRRIWKPMLKKQIEQGKLSAGGPGVSAGVQGLMMASMPGASVGMDNPHSIQAMRTHYQQVHDQTMQAQQQATTVDSYNSAPANQYYISHPGESLATSSSIGTLPQMPSNMNLSKTDSHAVLMELFARDQDLVRQATESARLKAEQRQYPQQEQMQQDQQQNQHPMKAPSQGGLSNVPTLNSWPHFSSINSLNNLGTIPGVKSITSLSQADLANKGSFNKMGSLAQVKSMESMGKNDSYAFLEVFFGDRSSTNLSAMGGKDAKGSMKGAGEEDNEIGLSLEDESPMQVVKGENSTPVPSTSAPAPMVSQESAMDSGTLKRAYDDALAARGLMSVSRSCEKLTDLVLPAKIQRTLSQEFMNKQQLQKQQFQGQACDHFDYKVSNIMNSSDQAPRPQQYSGQHPGEHSTEPDNSDPETSGEVKVSNTTKCALCQQTNVDTQLRPCGCMFHERCLKPALQTPMGQPKCPIDDIPMHSAVLAIPTDDSRSQTQQPSSSSWPYSHQPPVETHHQN